MGGRIENVRGEGEDGCGEKSNWVMKPKGNEGDKDRKNIIHIHSYIGGSIDK